jgi:hypothetical protein
MLGTMTTHPTPPLLKGLSRKRSAVVSLLLAGAAVAIVSGGSLLLAFGLHGTIRTAHSEIATPANAVVSPVMAIASTNAAERLTGRTSLTASVRSLDASNVFIGIAAARDVDHYLAGASTTRVQDWGSDAIALDPPRGHTRAALAPPGTRTFWVAKGGATTVAALHWPVRDGQYRLVMMRADGRPGIAAAATAGIRAPAMTWSAVALLFAGLLLSALGVVPFLRRPRVAMAHGARAVS